MMKKLQTRRIKSDRITTRRTFKHNKMNVNVKSNIISIHFHQQLTVCSIHTPTPNSRMTFDPTERDSSSRK